MPYDKNLDQQKFTKFWEDEGGGRIVVSVYAYNNGTPKLQISRESRTQEDEVRFAKLGRMTREEVDGILPLIQEALPHLG